MTIKYVGIQGIYNLCITSSLLCITSRHLCPLRPQEAWKVQYMGAKACGSGIRQPGVQIPAQQLACYGHLEIALMHIQHMCCTKQMGLLLLRGLHLNKGGSIQKYRNIKNQQKHSLKILRENSSGQHAVASSKRSVVSKLWT